MVDEIDSALKFKNDTKWDNSLIYSYKMAGNW
jgi:hypothetical protein